MLQHAPSYSNPSPCVSSFAMSSGSLVGSGMTLQDVQMKEAQAELLLLQCWGEDSMTRAEPESSSKRHSQQEEGEAEDKSNSKWARPESKGGFGRGGRGKGQPSQLSGPSIPATPGTSPLNERSTGQGYRRDDVDVGEASLCVTKIRWASTRRKTTS